MTTSGAPASRRLRKRAWNAVVAAYGALTLLLLLGFDRDLVGVGALFIAANLCLSGAFVWLVRVQPLQPFHVLMYFMFVAAYVAKGVLQVFTGLNTPFTVLTIRTMVGPEDYQQAVLMVTVGHALLVAVLVAASRMGRYAPFVPHGRYLSNASINSVSLGLLAWVLISSAVMYAYGVAVMGTEGVSLPYKMSAVLFYSRLIVVPMALLYFIEKAVATGDAPLLKRSLALFAVLAVSEVLVRATKSPPFIMVLQVAFLLSLVAQGGARLGERTRRDLIRTLMVVLAVGLAAWPLMEVYRTGMVGRLPAEILAAEVGDFLSARHRGLLVSSLEGVFNRLVGFLEFLGLVATPEFRHELGTVVEYGDIATYYTRHYLGYSIVGHSSSPSMMGAALILGGRSYWSLIFLAYLAALLFLWQLSGRLRLMAVPVRCFLAAEAANVVIAGTLDGSALRLAMVFAVGTALEVVARTAGREGVGA